jgi:hypothetical protein
MAEWLGPRGAIRRILLAILPRPRGVHDPRLRPWATHYPLRRGQDGVEEAAEHGPVAGHEDEAEPSAEELSWATASPAGRQHILRRQAGNGIEELAKISAALYLQAISALLLVVYGTLRSIEKILPIGPLRDGALTRPLDEFVLDWFGDVYVLLGDPAQAASVRGRLVEALNDLHGVRCEEVVIVAHSGGAIVSYMTLADEANADLRVDRLITLGEGLNLAWLLTAGEGGDVADEVATRYQRLYRNVLEARPNLLWDDFWASQDPAPVGVLRFPKVAQSDADDAAMLANVRSHAIWNRLSFSEDHGAYWDNDEEFVLPMLRLLEDRSNAPTFFGDEDGDRKPSNRRRRRLSALSLWRQLSVVGPMAAIMVAFAIGTGFIERAGNAAAAIWAAVPGSDIVSGPLNAARGLAIQQHAEGGLLAETGVWVIAALVGLVTVFALIAPPERPVPWARVEGWTWVDRVLRIAPWLAGIPIALVVLVGATRFVTGATASAVEVGRVVLAVVVGLIVVGLVIRAIAGSPGRAADSPAGRLPPLVRDGIDLLETMLVMLVASFLTLAPFVAIVTFADVGRTVLGILVVFAAFQVIGRIGTWRWSVWDTRERMAARTRSRYPGLRRVAGQAVLLSAAVIALFVGVVADSDGGLVVAAVAALLAVLLGVSVDIFDASRQERRTPADSLLRFARATRYR